MPSFNKAFVAAVLGLGLLGSVAAAWYLRADRPSFRMAFQRAQVSSQMWLFRAFDGAAIAQAAVRARDDDWSTFAHDDARSGFQRNETGINRSTVSALRLRWARFLDEAMWSSPLAAGGLVYVPTTRGNIYALDAASGEVRWKTHVGGTIRMTPEIVNGALLVGVYGALGEPKQKPHGAAFLSVDAATGAIRWRTPLPGLVRSEPVVIEGVIYEGLAGGDDFSGCFDGRIVALDERTGKVLPMVWRTTRRENNGAGIWGPLSYDGRSIFVGTGNSCDHLGGADAGDSIVALSPDLKLRWSVSAFFPGVDDSDVGGGVNVAGKHAYVAGKNGFLYELDRGTGATVRRTDLKPWARNGGSIGTPTGDGDTLVISTGELTNPWAETASAMTAGADLVGFDREGRERFRLHSGFAVKGYAAFVPGVGFAALDRDLVGFDSRDGRRLWSASIGDFAYPSPVVVPSGVYVANNNGGVFAFGLPARSEALR